MLLTLTSTVPTLNASHANLKNAGTIPWKVDHKNSPNFGKKGEGEKL